MNAQHRRPPVAYISTVLIHWAPTGANTTTAEKAARVRNQRPCVLICGSSIKFIVYARLASFQIQNGGYVIRVGHK